MAEEQSVTQAESTSCELLFLEKCRFEAKTLWIIAEIGVFLVWKNADQYVGKKNIALH